MTSETTGNAPLGEGARNKGTKAETPDTPPAGPHAKPELTNADATPGAGTLPDEMPDGGKAGDATG